ncbi:MAG: pyridoxal 5'-phosphate synthase glutaminase subunit PdxT [Chloroflexi bacterium]|jgi:5'-phosphate synthase pdxT subunit|nr:pyridoxal 5'-phosphate synthase glutaminase subunit PdxT [Chloroflexota bacterium]MBT3670202.1 pyridoxal 5'-phosphate synthase glutaminase subunit PdxT [Chloroflexota bacterium]MBT4002132.1 pyridoxal 5'-phosphate synthase glutaminase subunit PdxT [Chloroflexota bacterium]MBT4306124.1 pyridoxal 5'-phosphate synthase glutaminase subunit PdxT [Chloroflexota bacterium]MBT4534504.1 pyridoxal 5'-phosphate synthase glutaminase subunit PdxT [Chloroflexota bacterium]
MIVGVLAIQGDFGEHIKMLQGLGVETREVRLPEELENLDGLIIPGGESTTIGKLAKEYKMIEPLRKFGEEKAVWGTCAGAIFLSKDATRVKTGQPLLKLMDITIQRNAFGRQVNSFEVGLDVPALSAVSEENPPFDSVFIRAPLIESVDAEDVEILSSLEDGTIVAAKQGNLLATSFHPELNDDDRFHRLFLTMIKK